MSDPTLAKLSAADADLAAQEAKLIAQLEAIQTKRASLRAVLEIFDLDATTTQPTIVSEPALDMSAAIAVDEIAPAGIANKTLDSPIESPPKALQQQATENKIKSTRSRKADSSPKSNRRGWREYLRDEYRQKPLPAVVAGILESHPQKVFEIAEVVNTIFVQTIPQAARKAARERVSNILAEGARKNQWRRGKTGCYSSSN